MVTAHRHILLNTLATQCTYPSCGSNVGIGKCITQQTVFIGAGPICQQWQTECKFKKTVPWDCQEYDATLSLSTFDSLLTLGLLKRFAIGFWRSWE